MRHAAPARGRPAGGSSDVAHDDGSVGTIDASFLEAT